MRASKHRQQVIQRSSEYAPCKRLTNNKSTTKELGLHCFRFAFFLVFIPRLQTYYPATDAGRLVP